MEKILYVKKKVGKSYLLWFQNSNLFFYLEEPAWFVFRKVVNRNKSETIAKEFCHRYSLSYEDSFKFVVEIRQQIEEMNRPLTAKRYFETHKDEINKHVYHASSKHCYNMFNKEIVFSYETLHLENYIHPMVSYLKTNSNSTVKSYFELFNYKNRVILRVNGELKGSWTKNESEFVKGRIFVELINEIHNKKQSDWLMTVHASAISNGIKTILFSASPGSGKTTIAAILKAHGYQIISDDFVAIEQSSFNAYPLPIAMSIKEGSLELLKPYFPELNNYPLVIVNSQKKVKYLPVEDKMMKMIFPVNEFVFIKYDKSVDFKLEKIEPMKALNRLLNEAWIPGTPENIRIFFDRILKASYYSLTYSNNEKALDAINKLFQK